ncbi:hypothetical protein [Aquitalea pelogenes]|uniref:hypothetical protein n=1 Tax=Aquitalea pelogenes TaxID=1293573 RepID=UPI0035B3F71B
MTQPKKKYITLSTLKKIFTDKHIKKHFPHPEFIHRERVGCENFKVDMKMYSLDAVLEAITNGVPARLKLTDDYEHYQVLQKAILVAKLEKNLVKTTTKQKPNKI